MSDQMSDSDAYLSGLLNQSSGEATAGLAVSDAEFMVPLREQLSRSRMSGARMSPAQSLGTQGARMSPAQSLGTGPVMSGPAGISEELGALAPDQVLDTGPVMGGPVMSGLAGISDQEAQWDEPSARMQALRNAVRRMRERGSTQMSLEELDTFLPFSE